MSIQGLRFNKNNVWAGAGESWDRVVAESVKKNLWGIENLSLIPGTVGGAVYQNIGAYGVEIKDVLVSVEVFDKKTGKIKTIPKAKCGFGYRNSNFQHGKGKNYIIIGVSLKLNRDPFPNLKYPDLKAYLKNDKRITIKNIRQAVIRIRKSKLVYPTKNIGTAGSFFKNPVIATTSFQSLVSKYPDIHGRSNGNNQIKLSAGQLIEKAGWKGHRSGNVGVSPKHALVLVNYGGAASEDIEELAGKISKSVADKFKVGLEPEVKIVT